MSRDPSLLCSRATETSVDNSNSALVKSTPPLASVAALSVYILTGCRGKMVNFWLNIMLHNHLAFKLKNGFLLRLSPPLFPLQNERGEGGGGSGCERRMMGKEWWGGKGEVEEEDVENESGVGESSFLLYTILLYSVLFWHSNIAEH